MSESYAHDTTRAGPDGLARAIIRGWALFGGCVLLVVVAINTVSVLGSNLFNNGVPGDFEMTEIGVAVAAFAFLPYCQIAGANVTADIFTSGASRRWVAIFSLAASLVALAFSALMLRQNYLGMLDNQTYKYTTAILQIPLWWAFVPILISLALLAVASVLTLIDSFRDAARG